MPEAKMKTFIEQKAELKREIEELERANRRLFDEIDQNEHQITLLQQILAEVGSAIH